MFYHWIIWQSLTYTSEKELTMLNDFTIDIICLAPLLITTFY